MNQTKLESLLESVVNQGRGIVTSFLVWVYVVAPLFGIPYQGFLNNLGIVLIFTTVSIFRGYIVRRFFNAGIHKGIHNMITQYYERKVKQQDIRNTL